MTSANNTMIVFALVALKILETKCFRLTEVSYRKWFGIATSFSF